MFSTDVLIFALLKITGFGPAARTYKVPAGAVAGKSTRLYFNGLQVPRARRSRWKHKKCINKAVINRSVAAHCRSYASFAMCTHRMAVAATVLLLCCTVQAADDSEVQLKQRIKQDISFLKDNVFSFWQRYGLDKEHGGFHGTLDRSGAAISPTDKGLIQQTRHIWYVLCWLFVGW
jgi:hypothetical protein